jgi:flavin reductase (DIM6/NTAB) family NADH-FMN oxidoreductase RutF
MLKSPVESEERRKRHDRIEFSAVSSHMFSSPATIEPQLFRDVCSRFASGVTVAAVCEENGCPHGLTASSFTAVSLQPPLVLVCIDHNSGVLAHFRAAGRFSVNILRANQEMVSNQFATRSVDRFAGVDWTPAPLGSPWIAGSLARLECATQQIVDAGDHAVLFGEVISAECESGDPLLYFDRNYRHLR